MKTVYRTVEGCRRGDQTIMQTYTLTDAGAVVASADRVELGKSDLETGQLNASIHAAAAQGSWTAQNDLGCIHEGGYGGVKRDAAQAAVWYGKAAEQGFAQAQHNLAVLHERGRGVERSLPLAFDLYSRSAKQGNPASQYNLATLYGMGRGTERDLNQSLDWFCEAGRREFGNAAEMVLFVQGEIHRAGGGGSKSSPSDQASTGAAAIQPEEPASLLAVYVLRQKTNPTQEEIAKLLSDGFQELFGAHAVPALLKLKACLPAGQGGYRFSSNLTRDGDVRGLMNDFIHMSGNWNFLDHPKHYEICYHECDSGHSNEPTCVAFVFGPDPQDFDPFLVDVAGLALSKGSNEEAVRLLRKASEQGMEQAQYNLGVLLYEGQGTTQDHTQSRKWFEAAARQDYANAVYMLAFMLENGQGGAKDLRRAFDLYRRGAKFDEADSIYKLALLHLSPELQRVVGEVPRAVGWDFVPVDHAEARRLLCRGRNLDHQLSGRALALLDWGWPPLRELAREQNLKLQKSFQARGARYLAYAAERWNGLFFLPFWGRIEEEALRLFDLAKASGKPTSGRIEEPGAEGRVVLLTVANGNLSALIKSFPGGDYRRVYGQERQKFREVHDWKLRDFVHWMFVWDDDGCENHMLYQFSRVAINRLVDYEADHQMKQGKKPPYEVFLPPRIIPESVISAATFGPFLDEVLALEAEM